VPKPSKTDIAVVTPAFLVLTALLWQYIPAPLCITMVVGGSMHPTIEPTSLALGVSTAFIKPQTNDVIIVKLDNHYVIHRLIYVNESIGITKGDANHEQDPPINISDIIYVVVMTIPPNISTYMLATLYFYILFSFTYVAYRIHNLNTRRTS